MKNSRITFTLLPLCFLLVFKACKKSDDESEITIKTIQVSEITAFSATVTGEIVSTGNGMSDHGIICSTSPNADNGNRVSLGRPVNKGQFTATLENLEPGVVYYVRAYGELMFRYVYGEEQEFTTLAGLAEVTTNEISNISTNTAICGGEVLFDGGSQVTAKGVCLGKNSNPTVDDNLEKTIDGTGLGPFSSSITELDANTTYYVRAYATNKLGTAYGEEQVFTTYLTGLTGNVTDVDGNNYKWVGIGDEIWMAENLKVTHYPDGNEVRLITDNDEWSRLVRDDEAFCYYNNDAASEYGALYTYNAANKVCPDGWHLPTDNEWTKLENYLTDRGHRGTSATVLKAKKGWYNSGNGTDNYGFTALPGSYRHAHTGDFTDIRKIGYWWTSTSTDRDGYYRYMYHDLTRVVRETGGTKSHGFSVRCVKN